MSVSRTNLWDIFLVFLRISLCSFGGGYTVLPLMQKELVDKRRWLAETELTDDYALAQCMPGLIILNTAILVVRPRFGKLAAVVAVLGIIIPPLFIVMLIAALLTGFADLPVVQHALAGVRAAVAALILWSAWRLIKSGVKNKGHFVIFLAALIAVFFDLVGVIPVILLAMAAGLLLGLIRYRREGRRSE